MSELLGSAKLILRTSDKEFNAGVDKARSTAEHLTSVLKVASVAALAVGGAFAVVVRRTATMMDEVGKASRKLGITTEALSELKHAADLSDIGFQDLQKGIQFMERGISDAAQGVGEGVRALNSLGLSAEKLKQLAPEDQMAVLADALKGLDSQADRVAISMQLFGRSGAQMLPLLEAGSAGLNQMRQDARDLGLSLNKDATDAAEKFNDAITRLKGSTQQFGVAITVAVAPGLTSFVDWLTTAIQRIKDATARAKALREGLDFEKFADGGGVGTPRGLPDVSGATPGAGGGANEELKKSLAEEQEAMLEAPGIIFADLEAQRAEHQQRMQDIDDAAFDQRLAEQDERDAIAAAVWAASEEGRRVQKQLSVDLDLELIEDQFARQREIEERWYADRQLLAAGNAALAEKLEDAHQKRMTAIDRAELQARLQMAGQFFGDLAAAAEVFGGRQSTAFKAFAMSQAIAATYLAANKALASAPPPWSYALAAAAVAAGLANVYQIAHAHAGLEFVPREQTFLLQRGERVVQPEQNRDLTEFLSRAGNRPINVSLSDDGLYSGRAVRRLVDAIQGELSDGSRLRTSGA